MSNFVGFRLNIVKDADIIEDLGKYKDATARMKEVYRKGMRADINFIENFERIQKIEDMKIKPDPIGTRRLVWNFPTEPSVKPTGQVEYPVSIKANILSNGF